MITRFPRAWLWLVDETIPVHVKKEYSPRESWKDKPFTREDAHFFFKGIEELSALFTEERTRGMPAYFSHPKYRSAYLLYFLPLQAAKFLTLLQNHTQAVDAALEHAKKTGVLRIADLGAGPGTASISLLLDLLDRDSEELPKIELYWCDLQQSVMNDGRKLVEQLSSQFPKLRGKVSLVSQSMPWWKANSFLPDELSLIFIGHVLNETTLTQQNNLPFWRELLSRSSGGGILFVEPASRKDSQKLSLLRDFLFESEALERTEGQIWGPCLHSGNCPLAEGRDWCHFSVPLEIPGRWFKDFSRGLGSERQWVKYSYLWLASSFSPAPSVNPQMRRVVSDPLRSQASRAAGRTVQILPNTAKSTVLLCEPDTVARWTISAKDPIQRGDLIHMKS